MIEDTNFGGHWNRGHINGALLKYFKGMCNVMS